jgi:hypothetical protein
VNDRGRDVNVKDARRVENGERDEIEGEILLIYLQKRDTCRRKIIAEERLLRTIYVMTLRRETLFLKTIS